MLFRDLANGSVPGLTAGAIDYAAGTAVLVPESYSYTPVADWTRDDTTQRYVFAGWHYERVLGTLPADGTLHVSYQIDDAGAAVDEFFTLDTLAIDLAPGSSGHVVSGSLKLTHGGRTLTEAGGAVYADLDPRNGQGVWVGSLDLQSRRLVLTAWEAGAENACTVEALLTRIGRDSLDQLTFRAAQAPVKVGEFSLRATQLDGTAITATAEANGDIEAPGIRGAITYRTGIAQVRFGEYVPAAGNEGQPWYSAANVVDGQVWKPLPVYADSVLVNVVTIAKRAMASTVTGVDPARLPQSGALPIFAREDLAAVFHAEDIVVANPVAGATLNIGRDNLESIQVLDADGGRVPTDRYSATEPQLADGVLVWADPLDTTGHPLPWTVRHRIWELVVIDDVDPAGGLALKNLPLHRDFPAGAHVASLLYHGDVQAQASVPFSQAVWAADADGEFWHDDPVGSDTSGFYDYLNWPIEVTNRGATYRTRVALIFQTASTFRCLLEGIGQIGAGMSIHEDYAPINPATGVPIFRIRGAAGDNGPWGSGWVPGNVLRFNLEPGTVPVCFVKCLQPSLPSSASDHYQFELKGSIDRP